MLSRTTGNALALAGFVLVVPSGTFGAYNAARRAGVLAFFAACARCLPASSLGVADSAFVAARCARIWLYRTT